MKQNNNAYSFVEMLITATIMILFLGGGALYYSSYAEKIQETEVLIESKLQYTKNLAMRKSDGENNPYLIFNETDYVYLDKDGGELSEKTEKYTDVKNAQVRVSTNVPKNKIFFSSKGFVYDESGKFLDNVHIWITKGSKTTTISIDCKGNFSKTDGKDESSLGVCPILTGEKEYDFPKTSIKSCKSGEELINGECLQPCGENEHRNISDVCVCDDGFQKDGMGKCVKNIIPATEVKINADNLLCPSIHPNKEEVFHIFANRCEYGRLTGDYLFDDIRSMNISHKGILTIFSKQSCKSISGRGYESTKIVISPLPEKGQVMIGNTDNGILEKYIYKVNKEQYKLLPILSVDMNNDKSKDDDVCYSVDIIGILCY